MIRTFSMTEPPNAVAAKGGQMAIRPKKQPQHTSVDAIGPRFAFELRAMLHRPRRSWITGCLGILVLGATGCSTISNGVDAALKDVHECVDESMVDYRNRALAEKAWIRIRHCYSHRQYYRDFKNGFISGYVDVAAGGNGCTPAMAPKEYWGWRYQSPAGRAAVNAWFEGYPLGAKAAEQDGVGNWQSIQMNMRTPIDASMSASAYGMGAGGANPFYSEGEILPVPEPESLLNEPLFDELPSDEPFDNGVEIVDPESVFHQPRLDGKWNPNAEQTEIVPDLEVASRRPSTSEAELTVPENYTQEFSDSFVDDLFGTPADVEAGSDSDELPFSFE